MLNKIISIIALTIFFSFVEAQSISVYPKKGAKIKMKSGIDLNMLKNLISLLVIFFGFLDNGY